MSVIFSALAEWVRFLGSGVWPARGGAVLVSRRPLARMARVALFSIRGFIRDKGSAQAASLTYNTLLSIVPVLALLLGVAKGFGVDERLEKLLYEQMAGQKVVMEKVVGFALVWLEDAKGGLVAGVGVLLMFWTASKVLGLVEAAFNAIWQVPARTLIRKFTDYVSVMIICPLFLILSSSLTVYITTRIEVMTDELTILHTVSPLIALALKGIPFALMWVLFMLIYLLMPNTRVAFGSVLVAGLLAGSSFQLLQQGYINIMVMLSRYNVVYGSFAALPFFLIWMNLSWMILLFGAQVAHNHQHGGSPGGSEIDATLFSAADQKRVALELFKTITHQFAAAGTPLDIVQLADRTDRPAGLVEALVGKLQQAGLIAAVTGPGNKGGGGHGYLPAMDVRNITLARFLAAWESVGEVKLAEQGQGPWRAPVVRALQELDEAVKTLPANRSIEKI